MFTRSCMIVPSRPSWRCPRGSSMVRTSSVFVGVKTRPRNGMYPLILVSHCVLDRALKRLLYGETSISRLLRLVKLSDLVLICVYWSVNSIPWLIRLVCLIFIGRVDHSSGQSVQFISLSDRFDRSVLSRLISSGDVCVCDRRTRTERLPHIIVTNPKKSVRHKEQG